MSIYSIYQYLYEWISQRSFNPLEMPSDQNWRCFHQEGIQALHCLRGSGSVNGHQDIEMEVPHEKNRENHQKLEKIWKNHRTVCENHIDLWSLSICVNLCHVLKNCWRKIVDPARMVLWSSSGCLGDMMISPLFAWSDTKRNRCPSDFFIPCFIMFYLPRSWSSLLLWVYLMCIWCMLYVFDVVISNRTMPGVTASAWPWSRLPRTSKDHHSHHSHRPESRAWDVPGSHNHLNISKSF